MIIITMETIIVAVIISNLLNINYINTIFSISFLHNSSLHCNRLYGHRFIVIINIIITISLSFTSSSVDQFCRKVSIMNGESNLLLKLRIESMTMAPVNWLWGKPRGLNTWTWRSDWSQLLWQLLWWLCLAERSQKSLGMRMWILWLIISNYQ